MLVYKLFGQLALVEGSKSSKTTNKKLRSYEKRQQYHRSRGCPTCPMCEQERILEDGLLSLLAAQAIQALENKGINTVEQRSIFRESVILELHGVGLSSIPKLRNPLEVKGLSFRSKQVESR